LFLSFFSVIPGGHHKEKHEKKRWGDLKKWSTHPFWRAKIPFKNVLLLYMR
jgi:hypothetical protein